MNSNINPITVLVTVSLMAVGSAGAYESKKDETCDTTQQQYVFSWALSNVCDDKPRGGTSKGVDVQFDPAPHSGWVKLQQDGISQFEKDRLAILAMAGPYRVDFNFLETVGFSEDYERDRPYHSWGTEYVYVVTDEP